MSTGMASYDFIIIGGGTSGLVMASRLTENPAVEVLVVEAGKHLIADPRVETPLLYTSLLGTSADWGFTSVPQPHLAGRKVPQNQGKLLGGSSGINSQVFVPPSADIINTWEGFGNPGWTWDVLGPYYSKIHAEPSLTAQEKELLGITWGEGEGKKGMIQTSYPDPLTDPIPATWEETFRGLGHVMTADPFGGAPSGAFMPLASVDPTTATRSFAATAYWEPAQNRSNLHLLTEYTVQRILFDGAASSSTHLTATGIEYSNATSGILTARATKEVILAAGAFNSPKLLELSGIGNASLLNSLGVPVVVENANVGENLMDHLFLGISWEAAPGVPTKDALLRGEAATLSAAQLEYATNHTGPLTLVGVDGYAYMPVVDWLSSTGAAELDSLLAQNIPPSDAPAREQKVFETNRAILKDPNQASAFFFTVPFQGRTPAVPTIPLLKGSWITVSSAYALPFSRGNTHINSTDVNDSPTIDPRYLSHPMDLEVYARHVTYLHTIAASEPFNSTLLLPGGGLRDPKSNFTALDGAKRYVEASAISMWHPCGTCAMLPEASGGVVSPELLVYGTKNLRIIDASIFPLIPRGNLQPDVYAVAERASDLVKARYDI